jgi:CO/xanthine dehydrogenase FAD-binding subunit
VPSILAYHRPASIDEASRLLTAPERWALGGGTVVVPEARIHRERGVELVDLQGLNLDSIEAEGDRLRIGAMVRVADVADEPRLPAVVREAARRELPSALRNQATVGGTLALAASESLLFAALLVHDGHLELHASPARPLGEGFDPSVAGDLILSVTIDPRGQGVLEAAGRTPADEPIVAAVARADTDGVRLALTGVAAKPIEVDPADPTADLDPPSDFRGSSPYRRHLAAVLSARVLGGLS